MTILTIYGFAALFHIMAQVVLGHVSHLKARPRAAPGVYEETKVTVVVPVFNEPADSLRACLTSLLDQDHRSVEVIVVDDGSANQADHAELYAELRALPGWTVLELAENGGKRNAHKIAFDRTTGQFIVTIDSDTVLDAHDALSRILRRFADPRVGAVTGYVAVRNAGQNLLTRLIGVRYWMAFHQERAAQSLFGVMMCCSGPFSAFRRSVVEAAKQDYVKQRFLGRSCTYGDDRHLTNLVLRAGWRVVFDETVSCMTEAPTTVRGYVRQQIRWNKSFYREALWSLRYLAFRRSPYLLIELMFQILLPFCLLGALGVICSAVLAGDGSRLIGYMALIIPIGLLRALYGLLRTRNRRFLLFSLYGCFHVLVLIPVRLYALATIRNENWGTRQPPGASPKRRFLSVLPAVSAFLPGVALLTLTTVVMSLGTGVRTREATSKAGARYSALSRWPLPCHAATRDQLCGRFSKLSVGSFTRRQSDAPQAQSRGAGCALGPHTADGASIHPSALYRAPLANPSMPAASHPPRACFPGDHGTGDPGLEPGTSYHDCAGDAGYGWDTGLAICRAA